jgi:hypothetical protein
MAMGIRRLWTLLGTLGLIAIAATAAAQIWAGGYDARRRASPPRRRFQAASISAG